MEHIFHSLCVPVKGFLRTAVYDLQMDDYFFVDKNITEIISKNIMPEYTLDLMKERVVFGNTSSLEFQKISEEKYDYPSSISNAIVEVDEFSDINKILETLGSVNCYNVQWVFKSNNSNIASFFESFIKKIYDSAIKYCELVISEDGFLQVENFIERKKFPELSLLYVHSTRKSENIEGDRDRPPIVKLNLEYNYSLNSNLKSVNFFTINYLLYSESLEYNSYYNRKAFINLNGDVSAGPLMKTISGNIYSEEFNWGEFLNDERILELWEGKLPPKQYVLKVDKLFNFKTTKDEKEHIQSCSDCRHS